MAGDARGLTHRRAVVAAVRLAWLAAAGLGGPGLRAADIADDRPNVIFILADDLGWGDLGCYGNPQIDTPVLDALAARGVRLTAHYSPSCLCAPARAGYLTGRHPHRTGAVDVPSNRGLDRIDLSEATFGDWFRHAGYATALIGKWHNGLYTRDQLPQHRGFDLFWGFPNGGQDYWRWNLLANDAPVPHDGRYLTDAFNDRAVRFIREHRDRPFALVLAHHAPHAPLQAPEPLVEKYRVRLGPEASGAVAVTYAMIEAMDTGLGRVFDALDDEGLRERTIVVFTSDNGPVLGRDPRLGSQRRFNGAWSGAKQDVLEGGIRVPALVAWPGRIPAGRVLDTPVHGCDWLPTLHARTARLPPDGAKPCDGRDILPLLQGEPAAELAERPLFFQHNRYAPVQHANAAIRAGRWKLVWPGTGATRVKDAGRDNPAYLRGIVEPHWEMPLDRQLDPPDAGRQPPPRLFDLEADPAEEADLAAGHPEIVARLAARHDAWFTEVTAEWREARDRILAHDRAVWRGRRPPDPVPLFHGFWQWAAAPPGTDPATADPLEIFRGYWNDGDDDRPAAAARRPPHARRQPNILLVMTDDQGYGDLSIHGNPHLRTPHIDRLGETGVRFDRFFVSSFCAPTRAALLTGRWPLRTGCHGVTHNREAMRASEVTIAEALATAGYRTACIGKWHNGEQYPLTPPGQGFDEFLGFTGGHWNRSVDATLLRGATPEPTRGYISDVLTDEAVRFVSANRERPFFCYVSYNAPHSPYQVPDRYFDRFHALGLADDVAAFFGMCENLDDNVGRLLAHLEREGLADDTIVLFLTDNGGTAGVKIHNAGMSGAKTSVHEGGSRVPLFIRWPAAGWRPHVVQTIVSHIDILPTLLDLCGVDPPAEVRLDGISLRPLLEAGDAAVWPDRTLFTHNPIDETNRYPAAVRTQRYRLVREIPGPGGGSKAVAADAAATPWQLYDMDRDPGERSDIAAEHPGIVRELADRYDAWFADVSQAGLERLPLPVGHVEHDPVALHAPQAFFDPPLAFAAGPGFANDWLTGWTDGGARVWFDLDVAAAGDYAVRLALACPPADAGARIRVQAGGAALVAVVPAAAAPELPLPHRDPLGRTKYRERDWPTVTLGTLALPEGPVRLTIESLAMPGGQVMELKHVELERRTGGP
jgi:arylsulfatase A-like enzyme